MSTTVLVGIIAVQTAALATVIVLWARQRGRAKALEQQLSARTRWISGSRATVKAVLDTAALVKDVGGAIRGSIEELAGWAQAENPDLRHLAARDGTITIFFSDIEDSTALNDRLGDKNWLGVLGRHDQIVKREVNRHQGHIIKSRGDGFMIAFAVPAEAMRCAIGIQRALANGDRRMRGKPLRVRIGIHTGVALQREGDLFGRNVALAARVAEAAQGGQILVTEEVSASVEGGTEFRFTDCGTVELKGLTGEYHIQTLCWKA